MSLKAGVVENYLEYDSRDFDKVSSSQMADWPTELIDWPMDIREGMSREKEKKVLLIENKWLGCWLMVVGWYRGF